MLRLRRTVIQILRDLAKGSPHFYAGLFGLGAKYLVQGNGPPCGKVDDPLDDFFDQTYFAGCANDLSFGGRNCKC